MEHRLGTLSAVIALVAATLFVVGTPTEAQAAPCESLITVTAHTDLNGAPNQLREAISEVCDGGTIEVEPGLTVLTRGRFIIPDGRELTIVGIPAGASTPQVTIDANGSDRVFTLLSGADVTLDSLRLTGGYAGSANGGAIEVLNATLAVVDSFIEHSATAASHRGGGIYNDGGSVTLTDTTITANSAGAGGGVYSNFGGSTTMTGTTISVNTAESGGGIYNGGGGSVTLTGTTIRDNTAGIGGGGIYNYDASVTMTDTVVKRNSAGISGGGVRNTQSGSVTMTDSKLRGNTALSGGGGGILNTGNASVLMTGTIVAGNAAGHAGGGIANYAWLTVIDSTIKNNDGGYSGGGIFNEDEGYGDGAATVTGSIIRGNTAVRGGGVRNSLSGQFTVADTVISRNTADVSGGGIYNTGVVTATDTKIRRNTASESGGGIHNNGTLALTDTKIRRNTAGVSGGGIFSWVSITIPPSTKVNNNTPDDIFIY